MLKQNFKLLTITLLSLILISCSNSGKESSYPQSDTNLEYENYNVNGFNVKVSKKFNIEENRNAYLFISKALDNFYKALPVEIASDIIKRPIYIRNKKGPSVQFVKKARGIKDRNYILFNNVSKFYKTSFCDLGTPLIGAFAKEYYELYLTPDQKNAISNAFRVSSFLYVKSRASRDEIAYFINLTKAYFGINSYAPKDYHSLKNFDEKGFNLMEAIWKPRSLKDYECMDIESFRVMYPTKYKDDSATKDAIVALHEDLKHIVEIVPEKFVNLFRRKILWLDNTSTNGAACYHDSVEWLLENGFIREKSKCVELNNMINYVSWSRQNQPLMLLHEYAHMFHFSSYSDGGIILEAFENAMNHHLYDKVEYFNGKTHVFKKAYATNNQYEYFSELTEAYFGQNDFAPFNIEQLKEHDPKGFEMVEKVWNSDNFKE